MDKASHLAVRGAGICGLITLISCGIAMVFIDNSVAGWSLGLGTLTS
jgi:hypothetical protein